MAALNDLWRRSPATVVAWAVAILVAIRIAILLLSPLQLGPDEAQYWRWSRTLDWGYYSKPPLIAWMIALTTAPFGDAEWAVRLSSPVMHGLAAIALFYLGRAMADAKAGAWAAAVYMAMPGVFLSSFIMSTDAVLLAFWSLALFALWRLRTSPTLLNGFLFGLAVGVGVLAKYAALYLLAGAALAALLDPPTRRALLSLPGLAALAGLALPVAPNLMWNAAHDFATVSHTADNADWSNAEVDPGRGLTFLVDQMGVFGPVTLVVLLVGGSLLLSRLPKVLRREPDAQAVRETWLVAFILPPLVVILFQSIVSRAHANWAATAYPAAAALLGLWISRGAWRTTIAAGVGVNALVGLLFSVVVVAPSIADAAGGSNALKRVRGWKEMAQELQAIAAREKATSIMFDEREVWHGMDYYGRNLPGLPPIRAWRRGDHARSFAEEAGTLQAGEDARALVVVDGPDFRGLIAGDFRQIDDIGAMSTPLGPKKTRDLGLFIASGYDPLPRTEDYERRYAGELPPPPRAAPQPESQDGGGGGSSR